ncbi:expressed unknown protein [Seminavis robusta]|uniref:Uncharacterized protein n=1 Tax=Seminavis robusta TaxID=568900 RepID=A0A9N8HMX6_9STRA|nr:expressed unknown protein [Seminavis robusta]|eukprot:Sro779_g201330.1 n/a (239) ;mRNA; f:29951-30667
MDQNTLLLSLLTLFLATLLLLGGYVLVSLTGDKRYKEGDGIGKLVQVFQIMTFRVQPISQQPRKEFVKILSQFIDNLAREENQTEIVGDAQYIKMELYRRMVGETFDFQVLHDLTHSFVLIANSELTTWGYLTLPLLFIKSGFWWDYDLNCMKGALTATLCTIATLPRKEGEDLKEMALRYKLVRHYMDNNPFVGVTACPMLEVWSNIKLPKIVNTDQVELVGETMKYAKVVQKKQVS